MAEKHFHKSPHFPQCFNGSGVALRAIGLGAECVNDYSLRVGSLPSEVRNTLSFLSSFCLRSVNRCLNTRYQMVTSWSLFPQTCSIRDVPWHHWAFFSNIEVLSIITHHQSVKMMDTFPRMTTFKIQSSEKISFFDLKELAVGLGF